MKISKIQIKNLFGITEKTLDGKSVELSGPKGAGKTSVLDAIRYALTNRSDRDYIIRQGETEGEILIETSSGLSIDRKKRNGKSDFVSIREGGLSRTRPSEFLSGIFTPLQLDPVSFTQMSRQEKNRTILNLIDFPWDMDWIEKQFGEIPRGVDYSKHILEVLEQIQAENGTYYQSRQAINRDIRNKQAFIFDIGRSLPDNYDADKWRIYSLTDKIRQLTQTQARNREIAEGQATLAAYEGKWREIQGTHRMRVADINNAAARERETLLDTIARAQTQLQGLESKVQAQISAAEAERDAQLHRLETENIAAAKYAGLCIEQTQKLEEEIRVAEQMKEHLNEYARMQTMRADVEHLMAESEALTQKIELARELPAQILATATIPVEGLTVENGIPLIHGLPISNLSDGELLELCVDVSVSKPGQLEIILIDGAERLDTAAREKLYEKCKQKGLQLIATRVTDSEELEVVEL